MPTTVIFVVLNSKVVTEVGYYVFRAVPTSVLFVLFQGLPTRKNLLDYLLKSPKGRKVLLLYLISSRSSTIFGTTVPTF